jgi:hypothetical protein
MRAHHELAAEKRQRGLRVKKAMTGKQLRRTVAKSDDE